MAGGRPTDYTDQVVVDAYKYIEIECIDEVKEGKFKVKLPTIEGLAHYLKISRSTLYLWQKEHPEFSDIIEKLQVKQASILINNGLSGDYNSTIAKVLLTKHGYTDKQEIEQKTTLKDERIDLEQLTEDELRVLAEIQRKSRTGQTEV